MKKSLLTIVLLLAATLVFAQNRETRDVGDFSYVSVGVNGELYIRQGNKNEIILEGDEDTLEEIETYVSGDKLKIRHKSKSWWGNPGKIKMYVTVKKFTGLNVSGSCNVSSKGGLRGDKVDLSVSGSGDIDLELTASNVDCSISGSGNIMLTGKGKAAELSISGSGKLDAADFELETIEIRISGSGSANIYVTKEINSHISGSGTIRYKGEPEKIANHSSGSGRLRKM